MSENAQEYLKLENVGIKIEDKQIISDLSFTVEAGKTLLLLGKEGSGKTSIMRVLMMYLKFTDGEINLLNKVKHNQIGFMPDLKTPIRHTHMSAWQVVICAARARRHVTRSYAAKEKKIARMHMEKLGIIDYKFWRYERLPAPEQQKMLLARALTVGDKILLLENPIGLMETEEDKKLVKDIIKDSAEKGIGVVVTSKDYEPYIDIADSVLCLDKKPYFIGTKDEFLKSRQSEAEE